jgi:hypothetical protein
MITPAFLAPPAMTGFPSPNHPGLDGSTCSPTRLGDRKRGTHRPFCPPPLSLHFPSFLIASGSRVPGIARGPVPVRSSSPLDFRLSVRCNRSDPVQFRRGQCVVMQ